MKLEKLTVESIRARPVVVTLRRPIVNGLTTVEDWPLILIDLLTAEGVTGRSYLEPYVVKAMRYLIPALEDLADLLKGRVVAPFDLFDSARKSLRYVGYGGQSLIAVSGLDMAAWDALAKAADVPLCVLLGGSVGSVPAYNSNGLWLKEPEALAQEAAELVTEGGFSALKLRLGRARSDADAAAIEAVRASVGEDVRLMIDYSQALDLAEALSRCHAIDELGLTWIEDPLVYDNLDGYARLTAELKTPVQTGEHFYGPREPPQSGPDESQRSRHAGFHADWRRDGLVASSGDRRGLGNPGFDPSLSRGRRPRAARHGDGPLARVAGLGRTRPPKPLHRQ